MGGELSMHCGLTGRLLRDPLSGSAPLARVERKGPGLIGRLSFAMVRLEAACSVPASGDTPGVWPVEGCDVPPASGVWGKDVAAVVAASRTGGGARCCCC